MKKLILLIAILISGISFAQEAIEINGKITIYNKIPRTFTLQNNVIINGFKSTTKAYRYTLGFRDIVQPTLTVYQKKGVIFFDLGNDYFTYPIIDFTQDQIDAYDQSQLDNDISAIKIRNYKSDGELANKRIWDRIMREYDSGNITEAQFKGISETLFDALMPMNYGLWKVTKSRVDAITPPGNAQMLAILDKVKEIVDNYILNNY